MKTRITGPLFAFALLAIVLGGYVALRTVVNDKSIAVLELNRQIASKTREAERLASVKERLATLVGVEGRVRAYFVPEASVVSFINELQTRGSTLGAAVEINSVAALPAEKGGRPTLKVALSVTGSFDAVVRTLGSVEYAPYDLRVTSLSLTVDPSKKTWLASLSLVAVSTKNPPVAGVPPALVQTASTTPITLATSTATSTTIKKKP